MSLWVDTHRPSSLAKIDYHTEQAERLKLLVGFVLSDCCTMPFCKRPGNKGTLG